MEGIKEQHWTQEIGVKHNLFDFKFKEVWQYRDLLILMVRRNFVANYKQTILGPLWFFVNPILSSVMYTVVFGGIAGIETGKTPNMLFYLAGLTLWNYFQDCLIGTSSVFRDNASVFGKVYFPRLIMPLSIIIGNLFKMGIQLALFLFFYFFYIAKGVDIYPNSTLLLFPLLIVLMASISLGFGMIISSLTTKYRDLTYLLSFGVQLLMYASAIIYPVSSIPEKYQWILIANPLIPIIETFKYSFLSEGTFSWMGLAYSAIMAIVSLFLGIMIFNKVEKSFMDTV